MLLTEQAAVEYGMLNGDTVRRTVEGVTELTFGFVQDNPIVVVFVVVLAFFFFRATRPTAR